LACKPLFFLFFFFFSEHKNITFLRFNGQKLNGNYHVLLRVGMGQEYVKVVISDGRIQGAVLIGETDLEETLENLILNRLDVTQFEGHLLDPNFDVEDYFD